VALASEGWRASVSVHEERELALRLVAQLPAAGTTRAVSVTELVAPRRAYWRAVRPVPFDEERQSRLDRGVATHRRLGMALATEGQLEVRVRRGGIAGRIDLLSDVPVEVKTGASAVEPSDLKEHRPDQVEQLAMYCALASRTGGRLLSLEFAEAKTPRARAAEVRVRDLERIRVEMRRRADLLVSAWARGSPDELDACRWKGRGCEYEEAGLCGCTGREPPSAPGILDEISDVRERADLAQGLEARLAEFAQEPPAPQLRRFRDLVYPRRAYFDRREPVREVARPRSDPRAPLDLYGRVSAAIESGPVGEVSQLPVPAGDPSEDVLGFLGRPVLLRTSRSRTAATGAAILDHQPQYALELGFRAARTGNDTGYLVLGSESAVREADRLQVFRLRFAPLATFERLWHDRAKELTAAEFGHAPAGLPPCPNWMYPDCPYRAECGCAGTEPRSQR
jgi:hypothetical protein